MDLDKMITEIHKKQLELNWVNRKFEDRPSIQRDRVERELVELDKRLREGLGYDSI